MNGFQRALQTITGRDIRDRVSREEKMAEALVDACLTRGYVISVNDGEEWVVKRSTDKVEILAAMSSTDEDLLRLRRSDDGTTAGWFHLVYGNDGWDVIADHADTEDCNNIWTAELKPLSDKLEAGA